MRSFRKHPDCMVLYGLQKPITYLYTLIRLIYIAIFHLVFIALKLSTYYFVQIFRGNTDSRSVVRHYLDPAIMARYIRVHPGYYTAGVVCLRLELYGCGSTVEKGLTILFHCS